MCENEKVNDASMAIEGYREIGRAYVRAVDVTKFTWNSFRLRIVALATGAGYLYFVATPDHWGYWTIASCLLLINGFLAWETAKQMDQNQLVISRAMSAGLLLEYKRPELGTLYRHAVQEDIRDKFYERFGPEARGSGRSAPTKTQMATSPPHADSSVPEEEHGQTDLQNETNRNAYSDADASSLGLTDDDTKKIGIPARTAELCKIYAIVCFALALLIPLAKMAVKSYPMRSSQAVSAEVGAEDDSHVLPASGALGSIDTPR
jgi:hypothetical protein